MEAFDAAKAGTAELEDADERDRRRADPLAQLEHGTEGQRRAAATYTQIAALQDDSRAKHKWVAWGAGAEARRQWAGMLPWLACLPRCLPRLPPAECKPAPSLMRPSSHAARSPTLHPNPPAAGTTTR